MNLLSILLKSLLSGGVLSALAKKTGLNAKQLKKLLPLAVPLLLKMLTKNASSKEGAASLLSALTQHTSKDSVEQQIAQADTDDGGKIVNHILGSDKDSDLIQLSSQSGLSTQQVSSVLSGIAPALLSGLSAATSANSGSGKVDLSDGLDLGDVMAMFGGAKPQSSGLLSGLFGKRDQKNEKDEAVNGSALLQLLLANQ